MLSLCLEAQELNDDAQAQGFYVQKGPDDWRMRPLVVYVRFGTIRYLPQVRGLRWPVVDGKETLWRALKEGSDPYAKKVLVGTSTASQMVKHWSSMLLVRSATWSTKRWIHDMWLCTGRVLVNFLLVLWLVVYQNFKGAVPDALCYMHPADALKLVAYAVVMKFLSKTNVVKFVCACWNSRP